MNQMEISTDASNSIDDRLGKCEVCNFNIAKYTCPKCELKTCCLNCLNIHKKELNCDGIRDKTKYIPIKKITESDLMKDYAFLENCTNYTAARKHDKIKRFTAYNRSLPVNLSKLKAAANDRNIKLNFLLQNFEKHNKNTTHYDWKSKVIYWRIEWRFINANNCERVDERCDENETITNLIQKYFQINNSDNSALEYYQSKGLANVRILLKAEGIRFCRQRYHAMDLNKTLNDNLQRCTIVEYPVMYVIYDTDESNFDIINSDEENVEEETRKHKEIYFNESINSRSNTKATTSATRNANIEMSDAAKPTESTNFLFSNENDSCEDNDIDDL